MAITSAFLEKLFVSYRDLDQELRVRNDSLVVVYYFELYLVHRHFLEFFFGNHRNLLHL